MSPFILHPDFIVVVDGATNWLSKVNPTVTLKHVPTNLKVTSNGNCSSFTNKKTAYVQLLAKLKSNGVNIDNTNRNKQNAIIQNQLARSRS